MGFGKHGQSFGMESTYPASGKKALHQTMKTHFAISILLAVTGGNYNAHPYLLM